MPSGRFFRHAVHRCAAEGTGAASAKETNTAPPDVMEWDIVMFSASGNDGAHLRPHRLGRVSRIESNGMCEVEPMIEQVTICFKSHMLRDTYVKMMKATRIALPLIPCDTDTDNA